MAKKLTLLGMVVAALAAFAIPAAASASPVLQEAGSPPTNVVKGAKILGTSTNAVTTFTALGTLSCKKVTVEGEVTENSGTSIKGVGIPGSAANKTETCTAGSKTLTVTKPQIVTIATSKEDKGTLTLTFIADVGPVECHFEGTGGFTYTTGGDTIHIAGITLTANALCKNAEGPAPLFEGDFTLETAASPSPSTDKRQRGHPRGRRGILPAPCISKAS